MTQYRKRPIVIEAFRPHTEPWPDWFRDAVKARIVHAVLDDDDIRIRTLEGVMRVRKSDWVIRGVKGELYPCADDIFAATYELATSPTNDATLLDRLHTAEARVAILESANARLTGELAELEGHMRECTEGVGALEDEVAELESRWAGVPWTILWRLYDHALANPENGLQAGDLYTTNAWLNANAPQEPKP